MNFTTIRSLLVCSFFQPETLLKTDFGQRRNQNPRKHQRRGALQQYLTASNCSQLLQNSPSQMLEGIGVTPLPRLQFSKNFLEILQQLFFGTFWDLVCAFSLKQKQSSAWCNFNFDHRVKQKNQKLLFILSFPTFSWNTDIENEASS